MKEKTYVEDVDRSMYDFRNEDKDAYKVKEGLNPEIVEQISSEKHDPEWMKEFRMKSLEIFNNSTMPDEWGPSIEGLDMDNICNLCSSKHSYGSKVVRGSRRD